MPPTIIHARSSSSVKANRHGAVTQTKRMSKVTSKSQNTLKVFSGMMIILYRFRSVTEGSAMNGYSVSNPSVSWTLIKASDLLLVMNKPTD